jgi:hypothetical protein
MRHDKVFKDYGTIADKKSPVYWESKGYHIYELMECNINDCEWFLYSPNGVYWEFGQGKSARCELGEQWLKITYPFVIFVKERI